MRRAFVWKVDKIGFSRVARGKLQTKAKIWGCVPMAGYCVHDEADTGCDGRNFVSALVNNVDSIFKLHVGNLTDIEHARRSVKRPAGRGLVRRCRALLHLDPLIATG